MAIQTDQAVQMEQTAKQETAVQLEVPDLVDRESQHDFVAIADKETQVEKILGQTEQET